MAAAGLVIRTGVDAYPRACGVGRNIGLGRSSNRRGPNGYYYIICGEFRLPFLMVTAVLQPAPSRLGIDRSCISVGFGAGALHRASSVFGIGELANRALSCMGQFCGAAQLQDREIERPFRSLMGAQRLRGTI